MIDHAPRRLGETERAALADLARAASFLLRQRRPQQRLLESQERLRAFARAEDRAATMPATDLPEYVLLRNLLAQRA